MRKIVGILGYGVKNPKSPFSYPADIINAAYSQSLSRVGLLPFLIPTTENEEIIRATIEKVDAILIPGGNDIDPSIYGEEKEDVTKDINAKNDQFQITAIKEAIKEKKPIMGICRGSQIINVALGGTLYQSVDPLHTRYDLPEGFAHSIKIEKESMLYDAIKKEEIKVNSLHHQGIKTISPYLKASAYSPDGLIEAIESKEMKIIAVQYHPEALKGEDSKALFSFFSTLIGD